MAAQTESAKLSPEQKALNERRIYIKIRLPAVRDELKDLREERVAVVEKLKNEKDEAKQKNLRQRRIFISHHLEALKTELGSLTDERKMIVGKSQA